MSLVLSREEIVKCVTVVINGVRRYVAVDDEGTTLKEVFDAVVNAEINTEGVLSGNGENLSLNDNAFIQRDGEETAQTQDLGTRVFPGERVVTNRKHHNG